jgi:endogenous inhibitor of DNA gyrase (YacG/DUF329 family)
MNEKKYVACPTCKKKADFSSENPFRPFCSERCKVLDLGAWAEESYKIPSQSPSEELSEGNKLSSVNENPDLKN